MKPKISVPLAALILLQTAAVSAQEVHEIEIAVVHSLTGGAAFIGVPLTEGIRLAVDHINEGGLAGEGVRIVASYEDDASDRTQAMSLITRYAADPSVLMLVGPTTGAIAPAAAATANHLEFPLLIQSNAEAVSEAGPWSIQFAQSPVQSTTPIAVYAAETLGVTNCTVLSVVDNEAYVAMAHVFEAEVASRGVNLHSYEGVRQTDIDFMALGVKIATSDIDCLFISAPAALGGNMIGQFRNAGLDPSVLVIGHSGFASPELVRTGGAAVEGVYLLSDWVPGGYDDFARHFAEAYEERYGIEPDNWAPQGYSTMLLVADALRRAGPDATREEMRDALAATRDVQVVVGQGVYNYDENRLPRFGSNVLIVRDGTLVLAEAD